VAASAEARPISWLKKPLAPGSFYEPGRSLPVYAAFDGVSHTGIIWVTEGRILAHLRHCTMSDMSPKSAP
jgi:hypothetical protein